jgi:Ca2+-binding RTX toxin-like protein
VKDIAMGGSMGDYIEGGNGSDIIFGDFAEYNASFEFLPFQNYRSIIDWSDDAGPDIIKGGSGDDFLFGQEGADQIFGGEHNDDIIGGHNVRYGHDTGDTLEGTPHLPLC